MNGELLDRLVAEAAGLCVGARVERVLPRPHHGVALLFTEHDRPALDLVPGPPSGWLAATRLRLEMGDGPAAGVLATLSSALAGRAVEGLHRLQGDRVARLQMEDGGMLILELLGSRGNAYLLNPAGQVLIRFRAAGRPGGELLAGALWLPPSLPGESTAVPPWVSAVAPSALPGLAAPAAEAGMDPLLPLAPSALVVRGDGAAAGDPEFLPTHLLGDAVIRRQRWLQRHQLAQDRHRQLIGACDRARRRLQRLCRVIEAEALAAAAHGTLRRQAEALLAGLSRAQRQGKRVTVADPHAIDGGSLVLDVKEGTDLREHADDLFRRAGKLQRSLPTVQSKLKKACRQLAEVEGLSRRLEEVQGAAELDAIETALPAGVEAGRAGGARPAAAKPARTAPRLSLRQKRLAKDPRARRVKRYRLGEEVVLVGGNGPTNDFLTFRLAAAHDFWLHAADYPGAHVVLRNSGRRSDPPLEVLRQAAGLAAHFSKAPRPGPVSVNWTQTRHVRKGKGLPPGTVLLARFSTLRVEACGPPTARPPDLP